MNMYRSPQHYADVFGIMIVMSVMVLFAPLAAVGAAVWFKIKSPLARMLEFHDEITSLQRDIPTPPSGNWYQHDAFAKDLSNLASATRAGGTPVTAPRQPRDLITAFRVARPGGR
jgi:hypothetical protein